MKGYRETPERARELLERLQAMVAAAQRDHLSGLGFTWDCTTCNRTDRWEIDFAYLTGTKRREICERYGMKIRPLHFHLRHVAQALWLEAAGEKLMKMITFDYPQDGSDEEKLQFYIRRFHALAGLANLRQNYAEERNCLREAFAVEKVKFLLRRSPAAPSLENYVTPERMQEIEARFAQRAAAQTPDDARQIALTARKLN